MLGIYARSFMTATRTDTAMPAQPGTGTQIRERRWLPEGHWWLRRDRKQDPKDNADRPASR